MAVNLPTTSTHTSARDFVDALLSEQRQWTAVEQFSKWHDQSGRLPGCEPYHRLIPWTQPKPGQQYAFEVQLDKCSGCKACVAACHALNGLEEAETWRKVGLLVGAPAVQQHVTTACHHCVDPGCLNGCPVLAYDKDPLTGIVRHLDDQCIGCQYCIMKCPYEVPQYSQRLGIVRKCDMCSQRLNAGEAPACVQACPTEAIRIALVEQAHLKTRYRSEGSPLLPAGCVEAHDPGESTRIEFLPDSPDPALTVPATQFRSQNAGLKEWTAADHNALRLEPAHWPLIILLLLSQAGAGLMLNAAVLRPMRAVLTATNLSVLALVVTGMFAAILHLGQPLRAWRGFLGWRTSWLSRELLALHAFVATTVLALSRVGSAQTQRCFVIVSGVMGVITVVSSAMVYVDTGRPWWNRRLTFGNFFGSTLLLGTAGAATLLGMAHDPFSLVLVGFTLAVRGGLFIWRGFEQRLALLDGRSTTRLNSRIVRELYRGSSRAEAISFVLGALFSLLAFANAGHGWRVWILLSALAAFAGELTCRYQFFVASAAKRMPGVVAT